MKCWTNILRVIGVKGHNIISFPRTPTYFGRVLAGPKHDHSASYYLLSLICYLFCCKFRSGFLSYVPPTCTVPFSLACITTTTTTTTSAIFPKKKRFWNAKNDPKFGRRGVVLVIPIPVKMVLECRPSLRPSEKELLGWSSAAFCRNNTPDICSLEVRTKLSTGHKIADFTWGRRQIPVSEMLFLIILGQYIILKIYVILIIHHHH
jgi:hypothetical protein